MLALALAVLFSSALALMASSIAAVFKPVPEPLDVGGELAALEALQLDIITQESKWRQINLHERRNEEPGGLVSPLYPPVFKAGGREMEQLLSEEWQLRQRAEDARFERELTLTSRERVASDLRIAAIALCAFFILLGMILIIRKRPHDVAQEPTEKIPGVSIALATAAAAGHSIGILERGGKALHQAFRDGRDRAGGSDGGQEEPPVSAP